MLALVTEGVVVFTTYSVDELSAHLNKNAKINVSLPENPVGMSVGRYKVMPVTFVSGLPAGTIEADGFHFVVNGDVVERHSNSRAATLADAKAAKAKQIDLACQATILSNFTSSALGADHSYPAKLTDQQNLNASVTASLLPGLPANWTTRFWCQNLATLEWALVPHTAAQIQQVGVDAKTVIEAAIVKNADLQNQIVNAATQAELAAIEW